MKAQQGSYAVGQAAMDWGVQVDVSKLLLLVVVIGGGVVVVRQLQALEIRWRSCQRGVNGIRMIRVRETYRRAAGCDAGWGGLGPVWSG